MSRGRLGLLVGDASGNVVSGGHHGGNLLTSHVIKVSDEGEATRRRWVGWLDLGLTLDHVDVFLKHGEF